MKYFQQENVFVKQDITELMEYVKLVKQINFIIQLLNYVKIL